MPMPSAASRLILFLVLAFGLAWGWWIGMLLAGRAGLPGATHLPGLAAPLVAALAVEALSGRARLGAFLRRLVRWPSRPLLVAALILAPPVLVSALALAAGDPGRLSGFAAYPGVPAGWPLGLSLLAVLVLNGFGEEGGWRGWLGPALARRWGHFRAAIAVAAVWAIWHLPLFRVAPGFVAMPVAMLPLWVAGLLAGSFVLAHLYLIGGRSVLPVALWHVAYNAAVATPAGDGLEAALVTLPVTVWAIAVAGVWWRRRRPPRGGGQSPRIART